MAIRISVLKIIFVRDRIMRDPFLLFVIVSVFIYFMNYGLLIIFVFVITTEPLMASILPSATAPEFIVMDVKANMLPLNDVLSPMVAELPVCQKTFLA